MLFEKHPLLSQPIDIWSRKFLLAVTAQITISEIVCKNVNNVWQLFFFVYLRAGCEGQCGTKGEWNLGFYHFDKLEGACCWLPVACLLHANSPLEGGKGDVIKGYPIVSVLLS
jgi:hypothetical protein